MEFVIAVIAGVIIMAFLTFFQIREGD